MLSLAKNKVQNAEIWQEANSVLEHLGIFHQVSFGILSTRYHQIPGICQVRISIFFTIFSSIGSRGG